MRDNIIMNLSVFMIVRLTGDYEKMNSSERRTDLSIVKRVSCETVEMKKEYLA